MSAGIENIFHLVLFTAFTYKFLFFFAKTNAPCQSAHARQSSKFPMCTHVSLQCFRVHCRTLLRMIYAVRRCLSEVHVTANAARCVFRSRKKLSPNRKRWQHFQRSNEKKEAEDGKYILLLKINCCWIQSVRVLKALGVWVYDNGGGRGGGSGCMQHQTYCTYFVRFVRIANEHKSPSDIHHRMRITLWNTRIHVRRSLMLSFSSYSFQAKIADIVRFAQAQVTMKCPINVWTNKL